MIEFRAHWNANRDRRLEDLTDAEIEGLDIWLDGQAKTKGRSTFSEAALGGMARGVPGLIATRQMERNRLAREEQPTMGSEEQ